MEMLNRKLENNLEAWFEEAKFLVDAESDEPFMTFSNSVEKERVLGGIMREVLADFIDWCEKNAGYDAWSVEAMVKDYLGIDYADKLRYWEL